MADVGARVVGWVGGCGRRQCARRRLSGWVWQMSVRVSLVGWVGVADVGARVIG